MRMTLHEMIHDAVNAILTAKPSMPISYGEIIDWVKTEYGQKNEKSIRHQIICCTVNHDSRVHHHHNKKSRTVDKVTDKDFLFMEEDGGVVKYDPAKHGIWEIAKVNGRLTVRCVDGNAPITTCAGETETKQLFSLQDRKGLPQVNKSETELRQFICDNWQALFPQYTFIAQEFVLKGEVHALGSGGRIDILAYNPATKRFVFFELKRDYGKNIGHQASNYRCYIHKNFLTVYVDALQKHKGALPDKAALNEKEVEVILIAKEFFPNQIGQAEAESLVTLIEYNWFENNLLLLDYIHNATATKTKSAKQPGRKSPMLQREREIGKIWARLKQMTEKREEDAKRLPDGDKRKKSTADFVRIAYECIATKNAQSLYDEAVRARRPKYIKNAERILELEQNASDTKGKTI